MTKSPPTEDSLARQRRAWQFNADLDWADVLGDVARVAQAPAGQAFGALERVAAGTAAIVGSVRGGELAPFVPLLARDLAVLEREAAARQVSWSWMGLVGQLAVAAAMGAPGATPLWERVASCLPSIRTERQERPADHWNRGLAALALDLPILYRPIVGLQPNVPLRFLPGARFEFNVQGFIAHLAGAVEERAAAADCEAAWHELLNNVPVLLRAGSLNNESLVLAAIVLHQRIAAQPLTGAADYLRDSIDAALKEQR